MRASIKRLNLSWFSVALWAWALLVAYAGVNSFWTDSEAWAVGVAGHLFQHTWGYYYGTKPLLDLLLWSADQLGDLFDINSMWIARLYMVVNFLTTIYLMRRLLRLVCVHADWRKLDLWLFGFFLCHSFVIKRYLQIRSDLFTTTLLLLWVYLNQSNQLRAKASAPRTLLTYVACTVPAALLTPKSIPLSLLTFFVFELAPTARRKLWLTWLCSWLGFTAFSAAIALSIIFVRMHSQDIGYLMESAREFDGGYWSLLRWQHVGRALLQNPLFTITFMLSVFTSPRNEHSRQLGHWALAGAILLTFYPDRFPYFIASLVPLFLLAILTRDWRPFIQRLSRLGTTLQNIAVHSVFICMVATSLGWCVYLINEHTCHVQDSWVAWFTQRMRIDYEFTVYDPDGLIHLPEIWHWYIGPAALNNQMTERKLMTRPPDIILGVDRIHRLSHDFEYFIFENYWTDQRGIFIRRWEIQAPIDEHDQISCHDVLMAVRSLVQSGQWPGKKQSKVMDDSVSAYLEAIVSDGHDVTINNAGIDIRFTLPILENCNVVSVPASTVRIALTPTHITSPTQVTLNQLFRFDSED